MKTIWSHLQHVSRRHSGRDVFTVYTGFSGLDEIKEYEDYQDAHNYVYFPRITKRWEEDGKWYCELREADSCD